MGRVIQIGKLKGTKQTETNSEKRQNRSIKILEGVKRAESTKNGLIRKGLEI